MITRVFNSILGVILGLMVFGLVPINSAFAAPKFPAEVDSVLFNGKIITVDKDFNIADAVAIQGKKFLAVGTNKKILALAGSATKKIDLRGKVVVPGFIDSHTHADRAGWLLPMLTGVKTIADVVKIIENEVEKKKAGEWIITGRAGGNPDAMKLPGRLAEKRLPTRWELDPVSPDNPVWIYGRHVCVVNGYLLKLAGITKDTPDPRGGSIGKDPKTGEPTGILTGNAVRIIGKLRPRTSFKETVAAVKKGIEYFNSKGITSCKSEGVRLGGLRAWLDLKSRDLLTLRIYASIRVPSLGKPLKKIKAWLKSFEGTIASYPGIGDTLLRIEGGGEFGIDGGTNSGSAFQRFKYVGPAGKSYYGNQKVSQEKFTQVSLLCAKNNFRMNVHASGGAALDLTLNAWEEVNKQIPLAKRRWNIHHAQAPSKANFEQVKRLGVIVTADPVKMTSSPVLWYGKEFGENLNPLREWIDNGVRITLGSDSDAGDPNPMLWIYQATTRTTVTDWTLLGARHAITVKEALIASTINGAYATFEEDIKGSIEEGKLADLVLLSDDILFVPKDKIKDIRVLMTMVGGKIVYQAKDL